MDPVLDYSDELSRLGVVLSPIDIRARQNTPALIVGEVLRALLAKMTKILIDTSLLLLREDLGVLDALVLRHGTHLAIIFALLRRLQAG